MAKFSGKTAPRVQPVSPVRTKRKQYEDTFTHEGGEGFERTAKSELFLLAVTNMVGENTFYESAKDRDNRFKQLAWKVTKKDPEWVRNFIPYLRNTMQMRSASIVLAAHYVAAGGDKGRSVVDSAISRADEPAEILAYWAQEYGKNFPQPIKRGVADAALRLYNERNVLKYDGQSHAWRFGDVIELTHPKPESPEQSELFKYLISARHNRDDLQIPESASILTGIERAYAVPVIRRRIYIRDNGMPEGMTWERLSEYLNGPMDAEAWQSIIPEMGYMALLRNLRNFDEVGIDKESQNFVRAKLSDPEEVARSRQFPIRFYSAWKATKSLSYAREIEEALTLSVSNIPPVRGRSLVLVDVSGSMQNQMSDRSQNMRYEVAAVFGAAFATRNESDVIAFATQSRPVSLPHSILKSVDLFRGEMNRLGGGTRTWQAVSKHFDSKRHDRILILTDEQAHPGYKPAQAMHKPLYTFNLAGYKYAYDEQGKNGSYVFGGLTDAGFKTIAAIENLENDRWPWE